MDQINRVVPVSNVSPAHVYGVGRDRKERQREERESNQEGRHDVVELHDEVIETETSESAAETHDVDISA